MVSNRTTSNVGGKELSLATRLRRLGQAVRRAFSEFLTIPTFVIIAFLLLGGLFYRLDQLRIEHGWASFLPATHESISTLLGTIATSIITVTSITFSLLLIAVQQGAAALTSQVYDQFLRRKANQAYLGFFIGLALYCLVILATIHPNYTPVYGAAMAFALTVVALYLLVLLIYSTIDQMRPVMIVQTIRDHTLAGRDAQQEKLIGRTRRQPLSAPSNVVTVPAPDSGYLTAIDLDALDDAIGRLAASELIVRRSIGDYLSSGEPLIDARFPAAVADAGTVSDCLLPAFLLEQQRNLTSDPGFGIEQLATIGWTSASTSKSNPQPAILACWGLRDLVAYWFDGPGIAPDPPSSVLPIVYRDNVPGELLRTFESLIVVASESMQHQTLAELYRALALAAERIPAGYRDDLSAIVERSLSALGDHVLTTRLDAAIDELAKAMEARGMPAGKLREARSRLGNSIGALNARSTRVRSSS